jgi:hypothetical protein
MRQLIEAVKSAEIIDLPVETLVPATDDQLRSHAPTSGIAEAFRTQIFLTLAMRIFEPRQRAAGKEFGRYSAQKSWWSGINTHAPHCPCSSSYAVRSYNT